MLAGATGASTVAAGLAVPAATSGLSLGTVLSGAGLAMSATSAISGGNQAAANARYQSELYQRQADRERQIAALDESEYRRRGSALMATQRARLGGAGVDISGTALDVSDATAAELELQALKIRSGGDARASDLESQGILSRYAGGQAARQGFLNAGGKALQLGKLLAEDDDSIFKPRRARVTDNVPRFG
jgi:hypothetical protein